MEEETTEPSKESRPRDGLNLIKHAGVHFVIGISALSLWAGADAWYLATGLALASFLAFSTAIVAGVVVATLIHEWFHFAGAVFSGSKYRIPRKTGVFVYNFDYENNSVAQFNVMSLAGQLGSWLAVIGLFILVPMDNPGRWMLLAAAIGSAVFGGAIEWPVLLRTRSSGNPLAELGKITPAVFNRSLLIGTGSGLLAWYTLS